MLRRRSFLLGLTAALAAPALIRAEMLMPVRTPLVVKVTHVVRPGFPIRPGVQGSTWHQASGAHESRWMCGEGGVWGLEKPIARLEPLPDTPESERWLNEPSYWAQPSWYEALDAERHARFTRQYDWDTPPVTDIRDQPDTLLDIDAALLAECQQSPNV